MRTIATLGPAGTFSDIAAREFLSSSPVPYELIYFASIKLALGTVGRQCQTAILPIENFSEGFISVVLDALADSALRIVHEVRLPIRFSFVGNVPAIGDITKVFSQFVARGQCSEFLDGMDSIEQVSTQSNIESLELFMRDANGAGAIVPAHAVQEGGFPIVIRNVNDYPDNETRFVAIELAGGEAPTRDAAAHAQEAYKTSLIIQGDKDYPGFLGDILSAFSSRGINVISLVSRPSRAKFGQYDFFIDVVGHEAWPTLREAIEAVTLICAARSLGSYRATHIAAPV